VIDDQLCPAASQNRICKRDSGSDLLICWGYSITLKLRILQGDQRSCFLKFYFYLFNFENSLIMRFIILTVLSLDLCMLNAQVGLPYYNNFETDTAGWYTELNTGTPWQWDVPVAGSCTGSMTLGYGFNSAAVSPGMFYSPVFNVAGVQDLMLCMTHRYATLLGVDGVRIEYSYDNNPWLILGGVGQGTNWYNSPVIISSGLPAWSGNSVSCLSASILLSPFSAYSTLQFRFVSTFDNSTQTGYYLIDDFSICLPWCACSGSVGLDMHAHQPAGFRFSPNPAMEAISWELSNYEVTRIRAEIMDVAGRRLLPVFEGDVPGRRTGTTDISALTPGVYFIRVSGAVQSVNRLLKL
jgi:hypothetical protein